MSTSMSIHIRKGSGTPVLPVCDIETLETRGKQVLHLRPTATEEVAIFGTEGDMDRLASDVTRALLRSGHLGGDTAYRIMRADTKTPADVAALARLLAEVMHEVLGEEWEEGQALTAYDVGELADDIDMG